MISTGGCCNEADTEQHSCVLRPAGSGSRVRFKTVAEAGPIFAFTDDGLNVFPSLEAAAGYMEGIDVENGEWNPIFTIDGHVVHARAEGYAAILSITDRKDLEALKRHVRDDLKRRNQYMREKGLAPYESDPADLRALANEWFRREWEARWPKRPRWLDRRLHGDAPPRV